MNSLKLATGTLALAAILAFGAVTILAPAADATPCVYVIDPLTGYYIGCYSTYCAPGNELECYVGLP